MKKANTIIKLASFIAFILFCAILIPCGCAISNPLLGTWSDSQNTLTLQTEDGDYTYEANIVFDSGREKLSGTFQINLNTLILTDSTGNYFFRWDIRGNALYLALDGDESNTLVLIKTESTSN